MNKTVVRQVLGRILMIEALFMVFPLAVALIYQEDFQNILAFLLTIGVLLLIGALMGQGVLDRSYVGIKEGFGIVSLSWLLLSFFGSFPFMISGQIPGFADAFFESASGFTTTGASVLTDVEVLSHSILFWRSFTTLVGGMGILVFALAVLPKSAKGTVHIMSAEVPGPSFGKLVPKADITARILYKIYLGMTAVLIVILMIIGMQPFDAIIHGFGAAGTAGFSSKTASIGHYNSALIDYVIATATLIFGVNFQLYYLVLLGKWKVFLRSEELRAFILIVCVATGLVMVSLQGEYASSADLLRHSYFTVASVITTTGYATVDYAQWPLMSHYILLILMFIGSCSGSTAGGLKVSRVLILVKSGINEIKRALNPNRVLVMNQDNRPIKPDVVKAAHMYMTLYTGVFIVTLFLLVIDATDFMSAFSATAATLNNIGPGLAAVGPTQSYGEFTILTKIVLALVMIIGRLEIIPILVLFVPSTWTKK
ncbi:MAG: TrkH family potassium uptake protein [Tissierellia bacterium]|nr:TrkH family potassium uptake protein [Tissierellia bacterium]